MTSGPWDEIGNFLKTVGAVAGHNLARHGVGGAVLGGLMEAPEVMSEQAAQKKAFADKQAAAQQFLAARGLAAPQAQAGAQLVASGIPLSSLLPKTTAPRQMVSNGQLITLPTVAGAKATASPISGYSQPPQPVNLSGFNGYLRANGLDTPTYLAMPVAQRQTLYRGWQQQQMAQARARALPLPPDLVPTTTAGGVSGVVPIPRVRGASTVTPGPFVPLGPSLTAGKPPKAVQPLSPTQRVSFANGLDKMAEAAWTLQPSHPITAAEEYLPGGGNRKAQFLNDYKTLKAGQMGYDTEGNPLPDGTQIGTDANGNPLIWRSK